MAHEKTGSAELDRRDRPPRGKQTLAARFSGVKLEIPISVAGARLLFLCLIGIEVGLAATYLLVQSTDEFVRWGPVKPLFNLDNETSLPTWFSTVQLFIIGTVLLLVVVNNRQPQRLSNRLLLLGAFGFILLSADEGAMFHERITAPLQGWIQFRGGYGDWIVPYLLFSLVALLVLARPLARVIRNYPTEASIAVGGVILIVLGAVGLEAVGYILRDEGGRWYAIEVAAEEFAEMAGASMILYAVLLLAARATSDT